MKNLWYLLDAAWVIIFGGLAGVDVYRRQYGLAAQSAGIVVLSLMISWERNVGERRNRDQTVSKTDDLD